VKNKIYICVSQETILFLDVSKMNVLTAGHMMWAKGSTARWQSASLHPHASSSPAPVFVT